MWSKYFRSSTQRCIFHRGTSVISVLTLSVSNATIVDFIKKPSYTIPCWHFMSHTTTQFLSVVDLPFTTSITKPYPQINVLFCVCNKVLISANVTKKVTCLTQIPQHSYWPNLKHTPSLYKLNIFLWLQAISYDNFLNLSERFSEMHSTFCLKFKIGDLIEEILDNWSHEK